MNKFSFIFVCLFFVPFISQAYYYWERSPNGSEFSQLMEIDEYYGNSVSYHLISTEDWEKISKAKGSACESNYDYFLRQMRTLDEGYPYVGGFPSQSSQNQAQKDFQMFFLHLEIFSFLQYLLVSIIFEKYLVCDLKKF